MQGGRKVRIFLDLQTVIELPIEKVAMCFVNDFPIPENGKKTVIVPGAWSNGDFAVVTVELVPAKP